MAPNSSALHIRTSQQPSTLANP